MTASYDPSGQKRAVNLTLNSDLVAQAKALSGNLSGKVEALLAEFVASEHELQGSRRRELARAAEMGRSRKPTARLLTSSPPCDPPV